jgi:beta-carotene ketolase (CrtW type)
MMGIAIASAVILLWAGHLVWVLSLPTVEFTSFGTYLHIVLQAYLYTGLFITAHDCMHGTVAANRKTNDAFGQVALWLFAAFRYRPMFTNHMRHHRNPGTMEDPDFSVEHQHPIRWFGKFFFTYVTATQLVTMALLFTIGTQIVHIPVVNLMAFWVVPAFLGTFQLFYFGTYRPHKYPHSTDMAPHNSRTLKRNHVWAMLSCWFFGYHWEHHEHPRIPWWRLHTTKTSRQG